MAEKLETIFQNKACVRFKPAPSRMAKSPASWGTWGDDGPGRIPAEYRVGEQSGGDAQAVGAEHAGVEAFAGEVRVGEDDFIAVAHAGEHGEQCGADERGNAFEHGVFCGLQKWSSPPMGTRISEKHKAKIPVNAGCVHSVRPAVTGRLELRPVFFLFPLYL